VCKAFAQKQNEKAVPRIRKFARTEVTALETNASEVGFFSYRDPLGKSRKIDAFLLAAFEK
jgi:hypothetical protein